MSGHNKWSKIKRQKGAEDAAKPLQYHNVFSVDEAVRDWLMRDWVNAATWLKKPDHLPFDWLELKVLFKELQRDGVRYVEQEPGRCVGWSDETGCPGHESL